ncbi:hypothetical protein lerEdw1_017808 [Lerista edwardsae]|nr:hypothetical protein lerEdw1_017808 [Lerista edwardsae]
MGNADSKLNFRKAVIQLTTKTQPVEATDDAFWDQFWADTATSVQDVFALVPAAEIRAVREESPSNLATLCYKGDEDDENARPLAESLLLAIADLLFCPEFSVQSHRKNSVDTAEDIHAIDSCEYIWEAGVGFAHSPTPSYNHDLNRTELLKLLLTCFSEVMYLPPSSDSSNTNPWVQFFCSTENRHALPLFTSLLNIVCAYDPVGYGIPYNHLLFSDYREPLVEQAAQVLIVTLDYDTSTSSSPTIDGTTTGTVMDDTDPPGPDNLFVNYLSRIHREEDFQFILKGVARLLSNPLLQTYLPNSTKKIQFHQELLVLFWKLCDFNKKFLFFVLKSSDVLDILVPILYFLNDARADQSRVGLMHIGVFILLLLSGERNFGVRLNKPYSVRVPMDIPVFTGTHADLLIIVFHKIITSGHQRLQPLFDCLLTIIVNVSPYLKSLSMVAANKLLHLLEAFSTTWFLFSTVQNHHLVFFLLEVFNNIIQYQFDGNSNLVYAIIRKRNVFHQLANLPTDLQSIQKALQRKKKAPEPISRTNSQEGVSMEGSRPAAPAEPGTLKTSLVATPGQFNLFMKSWAPIFEGVYICIHLQNIKFYGIDKLTEKSQVSEDGTMRSLEPESSQSPTEGSPPGIVSDTESWSGGSSQPKQDRRRLSSASSSGQWNPTPEWVVSWKSKLPLQTIMRLLQVLVPQVEKICIDKGLTDESEILKFLQHGTLVGLLPVPHPILIRKYQANSGTAMWFRTYMWGVIYLRNVDPPIWYDTDVKLFEIQRV